MSNNEASAVSRIKGLIELLGFPPILPGNIEEIFLKSLPTEYSESANHLINARIETLRSIKSLLDKRIEHLEKIKSSLESQRIIKETVEVE
jgi:hypothetical protein